MSKVSKLIHSKGLDALEEHLVPQEVLEAVHEILEQDYQDDGDTDTLEDGAVVVRFIIHRAKDANGKITGVSINVAAELIDVPAVMEKKIGFAINTFQQAVAFAMNKS